MFTPVIFSFLCNLYMAPILAFFVGVIVLHFAIHLRGTLLLRRYDSQSIGNRYASASCLHVSRCMAIFNLTAKQELHPHMSKTHIAKRGAQAAKQRVLRMWRGGL
jgi:hypothetical protein